MKTRCPNRFPLDRMAITRQACDLCGRTVAHGPAGRPYRHKHPRGTWCVGDDDDRLFARLARAEREREEVTDP